MASFNLPDPPTWNIRFSLPAPDVAILRALCLTSGSAKLYMYKSAPIGAESEGAITVDLLTWQPDALMRTIEQYNERASKKIIIAKEHLK